MQRKNRLIVAGIILFTLFNIFTAPKSPMPWLDEVAYADPAATYHFQGEFQSSLWGRSGTPFWVGNVPLHPFLIILLSKAFGFNIYVVRGTSIAYFATAVILLLLIINQSALIKSNWIRIFTVIIAFSATGCVAVYRNGRYDALGLLLLAVAIASTFQNFHSKKSDLILIVASALIPWAGLQVIPYFGICSLVYLFLMGKSGLRRFFLGNGGMLLGTLLLLLFYASIGQLMNFLEAIKSQGHVWQDFRLAVMMNPTYLTLAGLGIAAIGMNTHRAFLQIPTKEKRIGFSLILLGLLTPWIMHFVSKYTIYYTWMATIPALIGFSVIYENCVHRWFRRAAFMLVLLSAIPGYPRRLLNIASGNDILHQNQIQEFINKEVRSDDKAMLDMSCLQAYYPVRVKVKSFCFDLAENEVINRNSTCIITNSFERASDYSARFGGNWERAAIQPSQISPKIEIWKKVISGKFLGQPRSNENVLVIYRRL